MLQTEFNFVSTGLTSFSSSSSSSSGKTSLFGHSGTINQNCIHFYTFLGKNAKYFRIDLAKKSFPSPHIGILNTKAAACVTLTQSRSFVGSSEFDVVGVRRSRIVLLLRKEKKKLSFSSSSNSRLVSADYILPKTRLPGISVCSKMGFFKKHLVPTQALSTRPIKSRSGFVRSM